MNIFSERLMHFFLPPGRSDGRRDCRRGVGNLAKVEDAAATATPLVLMALTESAAAPPPAPLLLRFRRPRCSLNGQFSKSALPKKTTFPRPPRSLPSPSLPLPLMQHKGHIFPGVEPTPPTDRPYSVSRGEETNKMHTILYHLP